MEVKRVVAQGDGALIHGANFSVGVECFIIAARMVSYLLDLESCDGFIEEAHHKQRDAPSGTAINYGKLLPQTVGREVPLRPSYERVTFPGRIVWVLIPRRIKSR